jgi:hypothetical protein
MQIHIHNEKMVLSRVDPLGYRLTVAVLRGGGASAGRPFCVFSGAWALANKILLVLSPPAPITQRQVLCYIFSPIQRPTLYIRMEIFLLTILTIWVTKDAEFYLDFKNINLKVP